MTDIWSPFTLGGITLPHRLAMAPMTRSRAKPDGTPGDLAPEYYAQRASLGLLISEGTQPSEDGQGYLATPGIYTDEHVAGWRKVTDAVHAADGRLFIQLMHVGRRSHPDNAPHHNQPVAPSAIASSKTQPELAERIASQCPGVMPKALRKWRVKCAWSAKPASAADCARPSPAAIDRFANSSLRMMRYRCGLVPSILRNCLASS